ncbi:MAG: hypothetical protein CVT63_02110 [Candidatus Anoxymicrobium japonicum]|uniref:Sensor-like histidine kinase SenX3 n=1 Tax=Candidatus Anoxymicrobium japonicum TaxID=2013648 RepID=A0A2N3G7F3_9ACTN|nr:MAG: hypothetical protein CVT63_02110 [Candidatus Anoxymicrobium japonicum]
MDKKLHILMLEANAADAAAIEKELQKAGISFEARRAESEEQFERGLEQFEPDLILSDYWLPSFDGISALSMARQRCGHVPFIFVSSALGEELAIDAMKSGATDYILKSNLSKLALAARTAVRESEERLEREWIEKNLRESERRFKSIFDAVAMGVVIIDPETHKIIDANPAAIELIGSPPESVIGQTCQTFICPALKGKCPITDLGQELDRAERVLLTASGERLPILKTAVHFLLNGRDLLIESFEDISAIKQIEKALRESEDNCRALFDVPIGEIMMVDVKCNLLAINENAAKNLGLSAMNLEGKNFLEYVPPELAKAQRRKVDEVINTGKSLRFEDRREGYCFDNSFFPLFDEKNEVSRIVIFSRDISEQKLIEVAQKKDREFISRVLDAVGAVVIVLERKGHMVLFNHTAEKMLGFSSAEVLGKRPWDILSGATGVRRMRAVFKKLEFGEPVEPHKTIWRTKGGDDRNVFVSYTTQLSADDGVEYIIVTANDMTELQRAQVAFKEAEERYRTVFDSTGTAMCIVDPDATIIFLNGEFERISGYSNADITGKMKFVEFLEGAQAKEFLDRCADSGRRPRARGRALDVIPVHFECSFKTKGGGVLRMLANMGRLPGAGVGTSAISLIDITREKIYEEDLKERAERLRDFLAVASHELRHPITIVKGYANTLTRYLNFLSPALVQEILDDIDLSTDRLTRYVEQLLDVSRVEWGYFSINREPVDSELLLKMACDDMRVMGIDNKLVTRVDTNVGLLDVDAERLVQLIRILVDNAIKFSPDGAPVEIEMEKKGEEVQVSVLDRGCGIPDSSQEKVFDRFYQVVDTSHHSKQGMGLGLYVASQIVEAHGGRIWVEPRDGGGSVFRFAIK